MEQLNQSNSRITFNGGSLGALEPASPEDTGISKVKFGDSLGGNVSDMKFRRPLNVDGSGATRCKIFHSKIADAPLKVMEHHINEWLDSDKVEAKFVSTCVGVLQGKSSEPNVIITIWY